MKELIKREIKCMECGVDLICTNSEIELDNTGLLRHCKGKCPLCGDHFTWTENYAYCGISYYDTLFGSLVYNSKGIGIE